MRGCFIGDPKQAIYGFRGADVFHLITASRAAEHHSLSGRIGVAEAGLVRAINRLFDLRRRFLCHSRHYPFGRSKRLEKRMRCRW